MNVQCFLLLYLLQDNVCFLITLESQERNATISIHLSVYVLAKQLKKLYSGAYRKVDFERPRPGKSPAKS